MGGRFFLFERGMPTGINPFQREPTEERLGHWQALVQQCLRTPELPLTPSDLQAIDLAVRGMAGLAARDRWMSTVRQHLPRNGENSLYNRIGRWCRGGELGWVFDQGADRLLDVRQHRVLGFDYTSFLDAPEIRIPVMMELLDVMGDLIDGTPLIYHVAEAWKALGDPSFAEFVKYRQKTIRKMNGLGIFDTQQVSDLLGTANGRVMVEQSVTKIILPNQDAVRDEYVDGLGLTDAEFELVRQLGRDGSRRFLVKQNASSSQCLFDLSGMPDMLTILSTSLDNVELLDRIRAEVGDDPAAWLPVLFERARARTNQLRRAA
jgi:type IV secretion system protein VirB4